MKSLLCNRLGRCCIEFADFEHWKQSSVTEFEEHELRMKRKEYPIYTEGCFMFVREDGLNTCLIQKLYGWERKPKTCREFKEELCPQLH